MGNFWGSIHLRSQDREKIRQVLEELAGQRDVKFFLGPAIKGWTAVYPENHGQDDAVGKAIAQAVGGEAFHLIVHDDDVFAYNFFRDGELIDDYASRPEFFTAKQTGRPELYQHLLAKPITQVTSLLEDRESYPFECERMMQFAKMLGMSNVETAYEYLAEDDSPRIKNRRQFIHIPYLEPQQEKPARDEQKAWLKEQGILLSEYGVSKKQWMLWCVDHSGGGFLLSICDMSAKNPIFLKRISPPWPKRPVTLEILCSGFPSSMTTSHTGRQLAIAVANSIELWSLASLQCELKIPDAGGATLIFSPDDKFLISFHPQYVRVISAVDGVEAGRFKAGETRLGAMHPNNKSLLINAGLNLLLVSLDGGAPRTLYPGGKFVPDKAMMAMVAKQFATIDMSKVESEMRTRMEAHIEQIKRMTRSKKGRTIPELAGKDFETTFRAQMEEQIAQTKQRLSQQRAGIVPIEHRSADTAGKIGFSADGSLLFCASDRGIRVYDWPGVVAGGEDMLNQKFNFTPLIKMPNGVEHPGHVVAFAEDARRGQLLFGGLDGVVYRMSLLDGEVQPLFTMPQNSAVMEIGVSADEQVLATLCRQGLGYLSTAPGSGGQVLYIWGLR